MKRQAIEILGKLDALDAATAGRTAADVGLRIEAGAESPEGILVFRALGPREQRTAGWLSAVTCGPDGVTFSGRTPAGPFRLRAGRLSDVQLFTYTTHRRGLACNVQPGNAVVVLTYVNARTGPSGLSGRAVAIEFPPPGYRPVTSAR